LELVGANLIPALRGNRYINIWDAGCAHGPEPYSIAIVLRENMSHMLYRNVRIFATDIDKSDAFGKAIVEGVYPESEIARVPAWIKGKYFARADRRGYYRLVSEVMSRVRFIKHDLLSLEPPRNEFSIIICKNVLLHFTEQQRACVISMFHSALRPGGFLVLEQTQKLPAKAAGLFDRVTAEMQIFRKTQSPGRDS